MREQLARYLNDERQGKVPDELGVHQYGSTVWLTVTRQRLVARERAGGDRLARSSAATRCSRPSGCPCSPATGCSASSTSTTATGSARPTTAGCASSSAGPAPRRSLIQSVLEGAERTALEGLSRLTSLLTTPVGDARTDAKELRRLLVDRPRRPAHGEQPRRRRDLPVRPSALPPRAGDRAPPRRRADAHRARATTSVPGRRRSARRSATTPPSPTCTPWRPTRWASLTSRTATWSSQPRPGWPPSAARTPPTRC